MSAKRKLWMIGLGVAVVGIVAARVVAPRYEDGVTQLVLFGAGVLVALAGLGIIMFAINKGLHK